MDKPIYAEEDLAPFISSSAGGAGAVRKDVSDAGTWLVPQRRCVAQHRRLIGMAVPAVFFHIVWWSYMLGRDEFHLFTDTVGVNGIPRWYMTVTMLVGSTIAGATSEGGGAVAFPMMTLAFGILPCVARDFSFLIQSVGMTSAAFAILFMRVKVEVRALVYCTLGGVAGIIFGLEQVSLRRVRGFRCWFICRGDQQELVEPPSVGDQAAVGGVVPLTFAWGGVSW